MYLAIKLALTPLLVAQALRTRAKLPRLPEADGERHGKDEGSQGHVGRSVSNHRLKPALSESLRNIFTVSSEYSAKSRLTFESFLRMSCGTVITAQPVASDW